MVDLPTDRKARIFLMAAAAPVSFVAVLTVSANQGDIIQIVATLQHYPEIAVFVAITSRQFRVDANGPDIKISFKAVFLKPVL